MPNHAQIQVIGHAGKDAELRTTQNGTKVASFSVAHKNFKGETTWYAVSVFGKQAENYVAPYLKKGMAVFVDGEPSLRTWESDGKMGAQIQVVARSVQILQKKEDSAGSYQEPQGQYDQGSQIDDLEDQIPF